MVSHALGDIQSDCLLACGIALSPITNFEHCGNRGAPCLRKTYFVHLFIYSEKN